MYDVILYKCMYYMNMISISETPRVGCGAKHARLLRGSISESDDRYDHIPGYFSAGLVDFPDRPGAWSSTAGSMVLDAVVAVSADERRWDDMAW